MSVEFIDTNILIYAHDRGAGRKWDASKDLLTRLFEERSGALSLQVLAEFYAAATKKLAMSSEEAEEILADLKSWIIHRPDHEDLLAAVRLHRRHQLAWWDALILRSAQALECSTLWSEDFSNGQKLGTVTVRNPFLL
jgi:predicted nucleic acid-binding protein